MNVKLKTIKADDFDLRQLAIFCRIVELRNFTRAAQALYITQPTVSARIADLERKVGVRLLDRRSREVVPTRAGEILYKHASELLKQRSSAIQELSEFLGELRGELSMGGSTIPGEYIVPQLIAKFKEKYPDIVVRMLIGDSMQIIELVASGKVELGIVGSRPDNDSLHSMKLEDDEVVLILPRNHSLANRKEVNLSDVLKQPFVVREAGSGTRRAIESALKKHGVRPDRDLNVVAEVGSTEAVKNCVEAGVGVSLVSRRAVNSQVKNGNVRVASIRGFRITRSFFLVLSKDHTPSPICREFVKFVRSHNTPETE